MGNMKTLLKTHCVFTKTLYVFTKTLCVLKTLSVFAKYLTPRLLEQAIRQCYEIDVEKKRRRLLTIAATDRSGTHHRRWENPDDYHRNYYYDEHTPNVKISVQRNATAVRVEATKMGDRIIHAAVPRRRNEAFTMNNNMTSTTMRILQCHLIMMQAMTRILRRNI